MFLAPDAPSSPALAVYSSFQPPRKGLSRPREGIEFLPRHPFLPGLPAHLLTGKKGISAGWAAARELHEASGTAGTLAEEPLRLACSKGCWQGCGSKLWEPLLLYRHHATPRPPPPRPGGWPPVPTSLMSLPPAMLSL